MKKNRIIKAVAAIFVAVAACTATFAAGCTGNSGRDGINGQDLNIYDIWEETKEQTDNPDLTFDEFLHEYLSYDGGEISQAVSLKASINRSLMSAVSIVTTFDEYTYTFGGYKATEQSYFGSGVIVDIDKAAGDITVVTNCHVVYSADAAIYSGTSLSAQYGYAKDIKLWLYGMDYLDMDSALTAEIVGASKSYDIAVIKVSGSDVVKNSMARAANWNMSEESDVGETVYTVGNANGEDIAATVGYISRDSEIIDINLGSTSRQELYKYRVLRTDAAINGGNSGGGLFDRSGELVGIINAKTTADDVDNMGYALCASTVRRVVQRLISDADGKRGIDIATTDYKFMYTVTDKYSTGLDGDGYARIKEVIRIDSASGGLNLESGDILTGIKVERGGNVIEDVTINREHNLQDALISVKAGDNVTFTAKRGDETIVTSCTFGTGDMVAQD